MTKMIKAYQWQMMASSLIILIPVVIGIFLWDQFPEEMVIHWGGAIGSRLPAVVGIPLLSLALHWVCILFTMADTKNKDQSKKAMGLIFWIVPTLSLFLSGILYGAALGREVNMETIMPALMAVTFIVMGNYLPKIKQNATLGIKVVWAVYNEENWNMTHRFGGKVWVIGGFVMLTALLLPEKVWVTMLAVVLTVLAVAPILYSYRYYRKQLKNGTAAPVKNMMSRSATVAAIAISGIVVVGLLLLNLAGDISVRMGDAEFTVDASFWTDLVVRYEDVDYMELRKTDAVGYRSNGFGSSKLLMGRFKNDEFGNYTRYTYTKVSSCIVLRMDSKVVVIGGKDDAATQELYERLRQHIPE